MMLKFCCRTNFRAELNAVYLVIQITCAPVELKIFVLEIEESTARKNVYTHYTQQASNKQATNTTTQNTEHSSTAGNNSLLCQAATSHSYMRHAPCAMRRLVGAQMRQ